MTAKEFLVPIIALTISIVDYEFRIKILEREIAHLKEMQSLHRERQDAHDISIGTLTSIAERIEANLEKLSAAQLLTGQKLQMLIDVLDREHRTAAGPLHKNLV